MPNSSITAIFAQENTQTKVVTTVLTHLNILTKQPLENIQVVLKKSPVAETFSASGLSIPDLSQERALVLLFITPELVLKADFTSWVDQALQARKHGLIIFPLYCHPIANISSSRLAAISGFPWCVRDNTQVFLAELPNLDRECCNLMAGIKNLLEKSVDSKPTSQPSKPAIVAEADLLTEAPAVTFQQNVPVADRNIPPLAIFYAQEDRAKVEAGMRPLLTLLSQQRNVRSYAEFQLLPGVNIHTRFALGSKAPRIVIFLSASALADKEIANLIEGLKPQQKVIFVLLSACLWQLLITPADNGEIIPRQGNSVVTVDSLKSPAEFWTSLGSKLFQNFETALPNEE